MRTCSRLLTGLFALGIITFCGCGMSQGVDLAKKAVDEFHTQFNAKQFDVIFDNADPAWKSAMDRETSGKFFARVQRKMGACTTSTNDGYNYNVSTGGTFVSIHYETTCANGKLGEQFRWRVDGVKVLLVAYDANSPLLLTD